MEPLFDLDLGDRGVIQFVDDGRSAKVFDGPWPVRVWITATDSRDGDGWGRSRIERLGTIVEDYEHDVGAGDETRAVLVEVTNAKALRRLMLEFQYEDRVPKPLY